MHEKISFVFRKEDPQIQVNQLNFPDGTVIAFTDFCHKALRRQPWWIVRRAIENDLKEIDFNPFGKRSIDNPLKKASEKNNNKKSLKFKIQRTVNRASPNLQALFPGLPIAIKGTGEFTLEDEAEAKQEDLLKQFYTMRKLFVKWFSLPEDVRRVIRPIEVYGVISYPHERKGVQQWLFMELVEGERIGEVSSYTIDGFSRGFNINHHPRLFRLVENNLPKTLTKPSQLCDFTLLERVFHQYGINLANLQGRDILWFDDNEGLRNYRLIDMRSHNFTR